MDVYGLVGNPVGHSVSPPMHQAAYEECGIDASYVAFEPAVEEIEAAIRGADSLGIAGLNVTIPFKQDVLAVVDPDPLAERIGAVNTIDFRADGPPKGYNTDAVGVTRSFAHHHVAVDGESAVVVGAGGAGRAAAFALADAGATVHIANRTAERAVSLADDVAGAGSVGVGSVGTSSSGTGSTEAEDASEGSVEDHAATKVTGGGLDTLESALPSASLVVNATSVGMESDETPIPGELLHSDLAVLDAVYAPLETRLLREAKVAGATTIDGAWMLLFQGVEAFERWTGEPAPVDVMNQALRGAL